MDVTSSDPPSDCEYDQRLYRHTERFYHPGDNCRLCGCNNGTVRCQHKPCPFASCSHPITQECCRTCEGTCSFTLVPQHKDKALLILKAFAYLLYIHFISLLQAACMKAESVRMGSHGMTHQTHVPFVFVARAQSSVSGNAVHLPTVTTQYRDSVACPVMVRNWNTWKSKDFPETASTELSWCSPCRLHISW